MDFPSDYEKQWAALPATLRGWVENQHRAELAKCGEAQYKAGLHDAAALLCDQAYAKAELAVVTLGTAFPAQRDVLNAISDNLRATFPVAEVLAVYNRGFDDGHRATAGAGLEKLVRAL